MVMYASNCYIGCEGFLNAHSLNLHGRAPSLAEQTLQGTLGAHQLPRLKVLVGIDMSALPLYIALPNQ